MAPNRQGGWLRAGAFLALLCLILTLGGCKRRRPIPVEEEPGPAASAVRADSGSGDEPPPSPQASPLTAPSAPPAQPPRSALVEAEPDKAPRPAFGFPVPAGLTLLSRSSKTEVYESRHSVAALERFFRREVGRDGDVEVRSLGFRVRLHGSNGFALVTQPPGAARVRVAIIGPAPRRARLTDPQSESPAPPPPPTLDLPEGPMSRERP